jgi:hypothetical protein
MRTRNNIVFAAVVAAGLGVASSAMADVATLKCTNTSDPNDVEYLTVDYAKSTVNNVSVSITPTSIGWTTHPSPAADGTTAVVNNTVDRISGTYTRTVNYETPNGPLFNASSLSCVAVAAPATKF